MPRNKNSGGNSFRLYVESVADRLIAAATDQALQQQLQTEILAEAPRAGNYHTNPTWIGFIHEAQRSQASADLPGLNHALILLLEAAAPPTASHQEKRKLLRGLGLLASNSYAVLDIIKKAGTFAAAASDLATVWGVKLVARSRQSIPAYKRGYTLIEDLRFKTEKTILCTAAQGFYIVPPEESVIFVSGSGSDEDPYIVELAVIRSALGTSEYAGPLADWLIDVIETAVANRRNQRPNQPGSMVQVGLNMGPRDARILGWGKSFNAPKLSQEERVRQDTDLIGAQSLLWLLVHANLPREIPAAFEEALAELSYPPLGTQNVPAERGFAFEYNGKSYSFSKAGRAPPEGIAFSGFRMGSHNDASPVPFTVFLTCGRTVPEHSTLPPNAGANFVDLTLKVLVQAAPATLTAFNSNKMHGTTNHGDEDPINQGLVIYMTKRVNDAIRKAVEENGYGGVVFAGKPIVDLSGDREGLE